MPIIDDIVFDIKIGFYLYLVIETVTNPALLAYILYAIENTVTFRITFMSLPEQHDDNPDHQSISNSFLPS